MTFTIQSELAFELDRTEIVNHFIERIEFTFNLDHKVSQPVFRMFIKTKGFKQKMASLLEAYSQNKWSEILSAITPGAVLSLKHKNRVQGWLMPNRKQAIISIYLYQRPNIPWTLQDIENFKWL